MRGAAWAALVLVLLAAPARGKEAATVAVLPFRDLSGQRGDLGEALRETVTADLKELSGLRVIERDRLDQVLGEQALQARRADLEPSTAARVGKLLGATLIVTGAYQRADRDVRLTARFVQVETGEIIGAAKVDGKGSELLRLQDRITAELLRSAGLAAQARRVADRPRPPLRGLRSVELYGQAVQARDDQQRYALLKQAVAEDGAFPYAAHDLALLQKRLEHYQAAADQATGQVLAALEARLKKAPDAATRAPLWTEYLQRLMAARRYQDVQVAARAALSQDADLEVAAFNLVLADRLLRDGDAVLRDGEDFLRRFPASPTFATVRALIEGTVAERQHEAQLEARRSERQAAEAERAAAAQRRTWMDAYRRTADYAVGWRCTLSPDPALPVPSPEGRFRADWGRVVRREVVPLRPQNALDPGGFMTLCTVQGRARTYLLDDLRAGWPDRTPLGAQAGDLVLICDGGSAIDPRLPPPYDQPLQRAGFAVRLKAPPRIADKGRWDPIHVTAPRFYWAIHDVRWPYPEGAYVLTNLIIDKDLGGGRYEIASEHGLSWLLEVPQPLLAARRDVLVPGQAAWVIMGHARFDAGLHKLVLRAEDIEARYVE